MTQKPKIIIPRKIYDKVIHWCIQAKSREISGLGKCEWNEKENTFKVIDAQVLKQTEQTGATTEIDAAAIGKYMFQSKDKGQILWWWHSHVDMNVFWSGTDHDCIESFGKEGGVVATVFNKRGEYRSAVRLKAETMLGNWPIFIDETPTEIVTYYEASQFEEWTKEYEAAELKYTKPDYTQYNHYNRHQTAFPTGGTALPPKKESKKWRKDPNVAYEGRDGEWWIWSKIMDRFRPIYHESELNGKDLYEFGEKDDGYIRNAVHDVSGKKFDSVEDIEEFEDDDVLENNARVFSGLSEHEWSLLTSDEHRQWIDIYEAEWDKVENGKDLVEM